MTVDVSRRSRPERGRRRRPAGRTAWGVALLSAGVAATSLAVPPLILSWSGQPAPAASPSAVRSSTSATATASTSASASITPTGSRSASKPVAAAFRRLRIDAADPANSRSGTAVTDCPICASGRRVQYLGQGHWLIVHVRKVPVSGRRTLTIIYESNGPRTLYVAVNSDPMVPLTLPGAGSWTTPARTTLAVDLPAGDSEIRFFNEHDPAPDLDQILIS